MFIKLAKTARAFENKLQRVVSLAALKTKNYVLLVNHEAIPIQTFRVLYWKDFRFINLQSYHDYPLIL